MRPASFSRDADLSPSFSPRRWTSAANRSISAFVKTGLCILLHGADHVSQQFLVAFVAEDAALPFQAPGTMFKDPVTLLILTVRRAAKEPLGNVMVLCRVRPALRSWQRIAAGTMKAAPADPAALVNLSLLTRQLR
jgi:hypothetical protein